MRLLSALVVLAAATHCYADCQHPLAAGICLEEGFDARARTIVNACRRRQCIPVPVGPLPGREGLLRIVRQTGDRRRVVVGSEDSPKSQRSIALSVAELDVQLLEAEAHALLAADRYDRALERAEQGLSRQPTHELLSWERAVALKGLGRTDEALAAFRPLAAAHPLAAYAAAAAYPIARSWLETRDSIAAHATLPGSARLHADGMPAGGTIAYNASGLVAWVEDTPCASRADRWLVIGQSRIPLGHFASDGSGRFVETGVTVANRLLRDFGFRFDPKEKRRSLREDSPSSSDVEVLLPSIGRVFEQIVEMYGCGDGGSDPIRWQERPG